MTRATVLTLAVCITLAWAVQSDPTIAPRGLTPTAIHLPDGPADAELVPVGTGLPADPAETDWATVGGPGREIPQDEATIPSPPS